MRKIREAFRSSAFALVIVSVVGVNVIAQEKKQEESSTNALIVRDPTSNIVPLPTIAPGMLLGGGFAMGAIRSGASGIVKNAPFSAEMVYESIQTLYDGNRIINRSSTVMYRDSQGRTRNESSFKPYLNLRNGGESGEHKSISIFDPVSGISYTLDPQTRTAHKFTFSQPADGLSAVTVPVMKANALKVENTVKPQGKPANTALCGQFLFAPLDAQCSGESSAKRESLGKQVIEGVEAEGLRITQTIPAGAMGNERPMDISHERWYSQELQMDVMVKWFDPRSGESTQRLTNINRSEPDASLFQPPSDYTIREPETSRVLMEKLREKKREANDQENR
jgi:hypothetical protein